MKRKRPYHGKVGQQGRKRRRGADQLKEKRVLKGIGISGKDKKIQSLEVMKGPVCPKKDVSSIFI